MVKSKPVIVLVVLLCIRESVSQNCVKVDTSEGRVTLRHGQWACAPLLDGETKAADQGKRFVICNYGYIVVQSCPAVLRFHAASGICQWPEFADCNIPGLAADETQRTTSITRMSPSTWLPKTATTTTSRTTSSSSVTTLFSSTASTTAVTTTPSPATASPTTALTAKPPQATPIKATPTKASPTTESPTKASPTTTMPTTAALTTSPITASQTKTSSKPAATLTKDTTNSPRNTNKQDINSVSTRKPSQQTNLSNQHTTTPPSGTQTTEMPKVPHATTQFVNNPSTSKGMQYTTSILKNYQTTTKTIPTTTSPIYSTPQDTAYIKSTTQTLNASKTTLELTTDNLANTNRSTEILYGTTTTRKTTAQHIKTTTTSATPINTTPKTTASFGASTKTPSTAHSTTASSPRTATADNGTPSDPNTVIPDDSEHGDQCNWETCQLPQCSCYGASPNISFEDRPMFLLLTFGGPMTSELYNNYYEMLMVVNGHRLFNQNGCHFRSTVFLAGAGTDYSAVDTLARAGHEIACGTLTDTLPIGDLDADYKDTAKEIDGLRKKVLHETKSQELYDSLVGFRAPGLRTAHDVQFQVLKDNQFLYDSSISNIEIYSARSPVWPYTMDFGVLQCPNPPCPSRNYSGLWEMPVNSWLGEDGQSCSYVDSCSVGVNEFTSEENDWYNLFKNNFEAHFYPAKVPMHISMRTSTPTENQQLEQAMVRWLENTMSNYNNVWLVTHQMVIDWIRDPLTNSQMLAQKWGC